MVTDYSESEIDFGRAGGRRGAAALEDGQGHWTLDRFAACFRDRRHRAYVA
jgi:hypothetical protein